MISVCREFFRLESVDSISGSSFKVGIIIEMILAADGDRSKFDAWYEHFNIDQWEQACAAEGVDMAFYTHRRRTIDEVFPWEHIDVAVTRRFLTQDYLMSQEGETRIDCRDQCFACGILPKHKEMRRETPEEAWLCPPVTRIADRKKRIAAESITLDLAN